MPVRNRRHAVARLDDFWQAKRVYCLALMLSASLPILDAGSALAQSAPASPVNMDLSSAHPSMQAPNATAVNIVSGGTVQNGTVTGGVAQAIAPGQLLTPAQYLAVTGAMKGGQTLQVNAPGQATGGYANLSSVASPQLSSILVPQNVSVNAIGFNAATPLNVTGSINILGSMHALQTSLNVASVLHSGDLNIGAGGLLSGLLPAGVNLGPGVFASGGMQIVAANNVSNLGSIVTPGSLSITAGGTISNQSTANSSALLSAQNINLVTGAGQVLNSGLVQAAYNININTLDKLTNLNVNSTAGTFEAISGAINVRDASYNGTANTNLSGGNWLSKELNLNSGQGTVDVKVGDVTGTINASAEAAHVLASTPKLTLGNMKIDGDPTYVNAGGDIQIVGTVSENEDLAIIASGNITVSGDAQIINHGHNVWMIAGAQVDIVNGICNGCGSSGTPLDLPPGTATPIIDGYVQVTAAGGAGGNIDLQTGNTLPAGKTVIDTSSTIATTPGGSVTLVAIANGSTGGRVLFPTTAGVESVNTVGNTIGSNGNVTILAGAENGNGVEVGAITAAGGTGFASKVSISTAQAVFGGGAGTCSDCVSFDNTGNPTGGIASSTSTGSSISVSGTITTSSSNGGTISLSAGGDLFSSAPLIGKNVSLVSGSNGTIGTALNPVEVNNAGEGVYLSASGGTVYVTDSAAETVTLNSTGAPGLTASVLVSLAATGDIIQNNTSSINSISIDSPTIILSSTGNVGMVFADGLQVGGGNKIVVNAGGRVHLFHLGDVAEFSGAAGTELELRNMKGSVTLGGDVSGSSVEITLEEDGKTLDLNGKQILATNKIDLLASNILIGTGTIDSPSVEIAALGGPVNIGGGSGGIEFSMDDFSRINAKNFSLSGSQISLYGITDLSSFPFALSIESYNGFANFGTILVGTKEFSFYGSGPTLTGNISSTGGEIHISTTGHLELTGDVISSGHVSLVGGSSVTKQPSTLLSAQLIHLGGNLDGDFTLSTPVLNLSLSSINTISITNTNALSGGSWDLSFSNFTFTGVADGGISPTSISANGIVTIQANNTNPSPIYIGNVSGKSALGIVGNGGPIGVFAPVNAQTVSIDARGADIASSGSGLITGITSVRLLNAGAIDVDLTTPSLTLDAAKNAIIDVPLTGLGVSSVAAANLNINSLGNVTINGSITATSQLSISSLAGSNASVLVAGNISAQLVSIAADGAGVVSQKSGTISGTTVSITTVSGNISSVNTSTANLILGTSGAITASNTFAGLLGLSTNGSVLGDLQLTNSGALAISSPISSSGSITLTSGSIALSGATKVDAIGTVDINSTTGNIVVSGAGTCSIDTSKMLTLTAAPGASVVVSGAASLANNSGISRIVSDNIVINSGSAVLGHSILLDGLTQNGSTSAGKNMVLNNSGTVQSTLGGISLATAPGQDLTILGSGTGQFQSPSGQTMAIRATDNAPTRSPSILLGPGNMTFIAGDGSSPGGAVNFNAPVNISSSITINAGTTYDFPNDFSFVSVGTNNFFGNPSQFAVQTTGHPNPNSSLSIYSPSGNGAIANSNGSIDLSQLNSLKFPGFNIAIIAGGDIINTGNALTIDLSSPNSKAGSLLLVAGYDFTPTTGLSTIGPLAQTYTFTTSSVSGGSINLGNVSVDTSGNGGGNVTAIASSGSIVLGDITTSGGNAKAGSVIMIGNGITVSRIDASAGKAANHGEVTLTSSATVGVSAPGNTQVVNGALSGGTFQAGAFAGTITGGEIAAKNLTVSGANIGPLSTEVSGSITAAAGGFADSSIHITNQGNLDNLIVSTTGSNGTISFENSGNLKLGTAISAKNVSLVLGSGKTLTTNGYQISSNNGSINLVMDSFNIPGKLDAGSGSIAISPATDERPIYLMGSGSGLSISSKQLAQITASKLVIGSKSTTGGIILRDNLDISSAFNLELLQGMGGGFDAAGNTLTVGSKPLVIDVGGDANLGPIVTSGTNISITGGAIIVNSPIGSPGDAITLTTIETTVLHPGNPPIPIPQWGAISGTGLITAQHLILNSAGAIGNGSPDLETHDNSDIKYSPINTAVNGTIAATSLNGTRFYNKPCLCWFNSNHTISISNTGNLSSFSTTLGGNTGDINITNFGDLAVNGTMYGNKISIKIGAGHALIIDSGNNIGGPNGQGFLAIQTDNLIIGNFNPGEYSISARFVTIGPTTPDLPINLDGGVGGLNISAAELDSIGGAYSNQFLSLGTSGWENVNIVSTGGINVYGPLNKPNLEINQSGSGGFNANGFPIVIYRIIAPAGTVNIGAPGTELSQIYAGEIILEGPIKTGSLTASQGSISGVGTITGNPGLSLAALGSVGPFNTVASGSFSLQAKQGSAHITNVGNVTFNGLSDAGSITFINTGNIELREVSDFTKAGTQDEANYNVAIRAAGGVFITQDGASVFTNPYSRQIITTNSPITLNVNYLLPISNYPLIDAGTSTITLAPTNSSFPINLLGGAGGMVLSEQQLTEGIKASSLVLGSKSTAGNITVYGSFDASNRYNLQFLQGAGGSFSSALTTLTMGVKQLSIDVGGPITLGTIVTSGTQLEFRGSSVQINNSIGTPADISTIVATNGSIDGAGRVLAGFAMLSATGGGIHMNLNGFLLDLPSNGGTVSWMTSPFAYMPELSISGTSSSTVVSGANAVSNVLTPIRANFDSAQIEGILASASGIVKSVGMSQNIVNTSSVNISKATSSVNDLTDSRSEKVSDDTLASLPQSLRASRNGAELDLTGSGKGTELVPSDENVYGQQLAHIYSNSQNLVVRNNALQMTDGEALLHTTKPMKVVADGIEIELSKGAVASIKIENGCAYIKACSFNGSVCAKVGGRLVAISSGEELVVGKHKLSPSQLQPMDGLARRNTQVGKIGDKYTATSDFSILSLITNHEYLSSMHRSQLDSEKRLLAKLLKTAATVEVVLKSRGAYSANEQVGKL